MEFLVASVAGISIWTFLMGLRDNAQSRKTVKRRFHTFDALKPNGRSSGQLKDLIRASEEKKRLLLALAGAIIGMFFKPLVFLSVPALALIGYRTPLIIARLNERNHAERLINELPDIAELLAVCVRAGLNLPLALERVALQFDGVAGIELRRVQSEIEMGRDRASSLDALSKRWNLKELDDFVRLLEVSHRFGSNVSENLENYAEAVRHKRKVQVEEAARKAPVKILFPLVFLILPAFIILTVLPLLMSTFSRLGF